MSEPMPVIFFGHGNPMNALLDNAYTKGWTAGDPALAKRVEQLLAPSSVGRDGRVCQSTTLVISMMGAELVRPGCMFRGSSQTSL